MYAIDGKNPPLSWNDLKAFFASPVLLYFEFSKAWLRGFDQTGIGFIVSSYVCEPSEINSIRHWVETRPFNSWLTAYQIGF